VSRILKVPNNSSRQLYISYLQTAELVRLVEACDQYLYGLRRYGGGRRQLIYWDIRDDAIMELRGRQLELFKGPQTRPADELELG